MRKRGVYFSLLTLAFTQMFFYIVYGATAVTGGENGLGGIERFPLAAGPFRLDLGDKRAYYYATAVLAAGAIFLLWRVVHSPFGRVLEAIRENEARASFVGYDVKRYKLTAFVVSCAFSGLAGTLYTFLLNFAYPESLHVTLAGEIAAMTLVGGMRSFVGPAVGAAVFVFMRDTLSSWTENWLVYFGVIFIVFVMFSPNGMVGVFQRLRGLARRDGVGARVTTRSAGTPAPATVERPPGGQGEGLLEVEDLAKHFGALTAVDGVSLGVPRGELRSIIGPNGAGKTTLFNVLTGLLPADRGHARFRSTAITGRLPHAIVAAGVSRSFQIISIFHALTVFENVRIAAQAKHRCRFAMLADAGSFADLNAEALEFLRAVGLGDRAFEIADTLSHGDQRLLEIAIALATRPELLLLDEPLAGLAAHERLRVADLIRTLHRSVTIVLIEHDIDAVLALSDRITVLHQGRVIAEGAPAEIQQNAEVQTAYLGHLMLAPEEIARRGIGLVPQGRRIFPNLTVLENLTIARRGTSGWTVERVFATFPKLLALRDARGATLSGGELQLLAIARALMGNVDLLLLDEPFEGLAPAIVEVVWAVLRELRGTTTVLLVEQNADLALALSDRAYVISNGSIVWEGAARTLHADAELRLKLLGV